MFKCPLFGLSSSQDIFQKTMSDMFQDIPGVEVVVGDLLIWGESDKQHDSPEEVGSVHVSFQEPLK